MAWSKKQTLDRLLQSALSISCFQATKLVEAIVAAVREADEEAVSIPRTKPFFYTVGQVMQLLNYSSGGENWFIRLHCYRPGFEDVMALKKQLTLINLGTMDRPEWRCSDEELVRWVKVMRMQYRLKE